MRPDKWACREVTLCIERVTPKAGLDAMADSKACISRRVLGSTVSGASETEVAPPQQFSKLVKWNKSDARFVQPKLPQKDEN
jgi:hypothetical protein